ncbi:hypothetical protein QYF36_000617 [Acer negundo]|nr:hypothetical protein QYF36_000617 [Acer negundo]
MSYIKVKQLWNGYQPLVKLKEVDLSFSSLISCPDLSEVDGSSWVGEDEDVDKTQMIDGDTSQLIKIVKALCVRVADLSEIGAKTVIEVIWIKVVVDKCKVVESSRFEFRSWESQDSDNQESCGVKNVDCVSGPKLTQDKNVNYGVDVDIGQECDTNGMDMDVDVDVGTNINKSDVLEVGRL